MFYALTRLSDASDWNGRVTEKFFDEQQEQSEAKARIVAKYFSAWAKVIMPWAARHGGKIAYIDLYAGPGRYKDGAASTPLLVLQTAIEHKEMSNMLVSYFNDSERDNVVKLEREIKKLQNIEKLKYRCPSLAAEKLIPRLNDISTRRD